MNKKSILFILVLVGFLCACKERAATGTQASRSGTCESNGGLVPISGPFMTKQEYAILAKQAGSGDAEAAFQLFNNFTYGEANYGLAYFWCLKAQSLGSDKIKDQDVALAERNILSEAYSFAQSDSRENKVKYEDLLKP